MELVLYLKHFGLTELPFGITPDTSFTYSVQYHQEALNTLLLALNGGEGFVKISGEVGTGKTLLCRRLLQTLDEGWVTAYLPNPNLDADTLFCALAEELGIKDAAELDQYHLLRRINLALLDFARAKKRVVLCIDEAQAMPIETLEALRLLSNLETEKRKLLQIVLFGQPELDEKLRRLRCDSFYSALLSTTSWAASRRVSWHTIWRTDCALPDFMVRRSFRQRRPVPCIAPATVRHAL